MAYTQCDSRESLVDPTGLTQMQPIFDDGLTVRGTAFFQGVKPWVNNRIVHWKSLTRVPHQQSFKKILKLWWHSLACCLVPNPPESSLCGIVWKVLCLLPVGRSSLIEGQKSEEQDKKDDCDRPHVGRAVICVRLHGWDQYLGCHEGHRTYWSQNGLFAGICCTQIAYLETECFGEEDVSGFEVHVRVACPVDCLNPQEDLLGDALHIVFWEGRQAIEDVLEFSLVTSLQHHLVFAVVLV